MHGHCVYRSAFADACDLADDNAVAFDVHANTAERSGLAIVVTVIIVVVVVVNFPQRPLEAFLRLSAVLIRRRRESRVVGTYGTRYFRLYRHTYYARKFCEYCSTPTYKH